VTTGWTPPGGPTDPAVQPPPGPPEGYGYANWGLAHPGVAYAPVVFVPRPPRPPVVVLAVGLTFLGVGLSAVEQVVGFVVTLANRDAIAAGATSRVAADPAAPDLSGLATAGTVMGLVFGILLWLIPVGGTVVTAVLTRRGSNAARIVLASLMGLFALVGLCGGVFSVSGVARGSVVTSSLMSSLNGWQTVTGVVDLVLAVLATVIGVLLLLPAANRYFSAGPGRRFGPPPGPVGSTGTGGAAPWSGTPP
jgi:hypothetical protein